MWKIVNVLRNPRIFSHISNGNGNTGSGLQGSQYNRDQLRVIHHTSCLSKTDGEEQFKNNDKDEWFSGAFGGGVFGCANAVGLTGLFLTGVHNYSETFRRRAGSIDSYFHPVSSLFNVVSESEATTSATGHPRRLGNFSNSSNAIVPSSTYQQSRHLFGHNLANNLNNRVGEDTSINVAVFNPHSSIAPSGCKTSALTGDAVIFVKPAPLRHRARYSSTYGSLSSGSDDNDFYHYASNNNNGLLPNHYSEPNFKLSSGWFTTASDSVEQNEAPDTVLRQLSRINSCDETSEDSGAQFFIAQDEVTEYMDMPHSSNNDLLSTLKDSVECWKNVVSRQQNQPSSTETVRTSISACTNTEHQQLLISPVVNMETQTEPLPNPFSSGFLFGDDTGMTENLSSLLSSLDSIRANALGVDLSRRGLHQEAAQQFGKAANENYAKAQYNLGQCYYKGLGVTMSQPKARQLWSSAAKQGHGLAAFQLGADMLQKSEPLQSAESNIGSADPKSSATNSFSQSSVSSVVNDHSHTKDALHFMRLAATLDVPEAKLFLSQLNNAKPSDLCSPV